MINNILLLIAKDKELVLESRKQGKPCLKLQTIILLGFPIFMFIHLLLFILSKQVCITLLLVYLFLGIGQAVLDIYDILPKEQVKLPDIEEPKEPVEYVKEPEEAEIHESDEVEIAEEFIIGGDDDEYDCR